jgi:uroporphyrin-3 C-methyltransferase
MGRNERHNMSERTPPPDNLEPDTPALPEPPRTVSKTSVADLFAHISITQMTLAVLVVIFLWQWLDGHRAINDMQQQLAKKIAEMDGTSKANQMMLTQSQDQVRELSVKVATLETHYAESQNQRAALEALYNDLSVSRDETALAEVQRMDRPAFNGLRKAIGHDIDKLRVLPNVDIAGVNFQLDDLIAAVDDLPLVYQQRASNVAIAQTAVPKNETASQKLLREIWQEARQLVRIEDTGKAEIPLLPPSQEFFLRENLKLRLLSARLALLSRDEDSFRQELKTAQLWTARYFDAKSNGGARMLIGLKKLAASSISIALPDISPSLQAVRNYRLTHENAKAAR